MKTESQYQLFSCVVVAYVATCVMRPLREELVYHGEYPFAFKLHGRLPCILMKFELKCHSNVRIILQSRLMLAVTRYTCVWEVPVSNLGRDAKYPECSFVDSPSPSTATFRYLVFVSHPSIRRCIVSVPCFSLSPAR